ncbi:MAG: preprotein translocase subunit SecY [Dehalococcoidia bacterium]
MEQLRAVLDAFKLPDLRRKILFTFAMLVVFRFVAHVPVPGLNPEALDQLFNTGPNAALLGMLDLFSGGALRNFSVAAMGVYPYITASIVMQLLVPIIPRLEALSKEGEAGRQKITQFTHYLTIPLAFLQGYGQLVLLYNQQNPVIPRLGFTGDDLVPTVAMLLSLTAGTIFLVWLGELITQYGIGNGVSVIIFGGIVANIPSIIGQSFLAADQIIGLVVFVILGVLTVAGIVVFTEAQRRVPVHYAKRMRGSRLYGGQSTHIPLKVNSAGMIPLIFAMSIMILPGTIASWFQFSSTPWIAQAAGGLTWFFDPTRPWYWVFFFVMTVGFTFFYTMVIFQQQRLAENLQKYGGFIPGIRPGKPTDDYLMRVLTRITWAGALFLGVIAILPYFAQLATNIQAVQLSSTGLLIIVGVVLDTMKQLEAQLLMRHYEGFIK